MKKKISTLFGKYIVTPINKMRFRNKPDRRLEIGPGQSRIEGFETINVVWDRKVDFVADASKVLPFSNNTFSIIYASHILEHVPWYEIDSSLREWVRVLKSGGALEIWVPNGLLIAQTWVNAENGLPSKVQEDGWYKFNPNKDAAVWANGRIFSYGDGQGTKADPNWHLSIFSPRFLQESLQKAGLIDIKTMERNEVRGYDHGWINLGMRGMKP